MSSLRSAGARRRASGEGGLIGRGRCWRASGDAEVDGDIQTTMNTYGHLFPSAEPAMAELLDAGYRAADAPPPSLSPVAPSKQPADAVTQGGP